MRGQAVRRVRHQQQVTLAAGGDSWEGREGDLLLIPDAPHSLTAHADSAVLLTVVKLP